VLIIKYKEWNAAEKNRERRKRIIGFFIAKAKKAYLE